MIIVRISGPSVMSFKSLLRNKYGCDVTAITTGYQRCVEKQARFRNHIVFSARCKRRGVVPPSLRVRSPINTDKGRSIARNAERQFLAERLRIANYRAKELEEERKWREIGLRRVLDPEDSERVLRVSAENADVVFNKTREQQRKKFDRLVCRQIDCQRSGSDQAAKTTWVINLSSHELTSTERGSSRKASILQSPRGRCHKQKSSQEWRQHYERATKSMRNRRKEREEQLQLSFEMRSHQNRTFRLRID